MSELTGNVVQWKRMWQLVSGIHYETPNSTVKDKLLQVSKEIQDGLLQYRQNVNSSTENLVKIMKANKQEKLLLFANKLQQYLGIDAIQSWDILCYYLLNEYRGSANSLSNYTSTESNMVKLLDDIWAYYSLERMIVLKIIKNIVEFHNSTQHPYSVEYDILLKKIGLPNLRKSLIEQFEMLIKEQAPLKNTFGDYSNTQAKLIAWSERRAREIIEILNILLLVINFDSIQPSELKHLIELFKLHSFGRQQEYFDITNSLHSDLIKKITYSEVAIFLKGMNTIESLEWIKKTIEILDSQILTMYQNLEHGPILLSWMLLNFSNTDINETLSRKYRQFGSKAVQLGCFQYLLSMISHPMFNDQGLIAIVLRRTIYDLLSNLCYLFDSDGSVGQHPKMFELLSELLTTPSIATSFCNDENNPIRSLYNSALENFPLDFIPLSLIASSLSVVGKTQNQFITKQLENLPVYSELYNMQNFELRPTDIEDQFILNHDYSPFNKIDFIIPRGTQAFVIDKKNHCLVHFNTKFNYFNALHHEINELLADTLRYTEINPIKLQRVEVGLKYLATAVNRIDNSNLISSEMVHPTEMVFDILIKFKTLQQPPLQLLAYCLEVCAALVPLFENDIFTRVANLNVLPTITNETINFRDCSNGISFDSGLVGYYLVNYERNIGRYDFLMAYLNFLNTYTKLGTNNIKSIELPGLVFLLREIFPHIHTWRFESELERQKIYILSMQYFFDILQLTTDQLKTDQDRVLLRNTCIYSLLNYDNGMILLKFIAIGNSYLTSVTENETNWMSRSNSGLNLIVQLSMTILMLILRLKNRLFVNQNTELLPLESIIYMQSKHIDTLHIIPVITSYMSNIFNRRLPILSCRLLRRFAIEFQISLLACLDMESDQIRLTFLQRLRDELENDNLKIAVLEFVEACIEKQSGVTEAFFKVSDDRKKLLFVKAKSQQNLTDGILIYMEEYLDAISNDAKKLASPLLSRIMSLFHALWKNNMQSLVQTLLEKPNFWPSLCNPLFCDINTNIKAYSQLFNILGIEIFKTSDDCKMNDELQKTFNKFLSPVQFECWLNIIFTIPTEMDTELITDETPEWLGRLQSFKDLMILIVRKKNYHPIKIPEKSLKLLAEKCLTKLIERSEYINDFRPFIILSELFLIVLIDYKFSYADNDAECCKMLEQISQLLNFLAISHKEIHVRSKESILSIGIKTFDLLPVDILTEHVSLGIIKSVVEIICNEIYDIETHIHNSQKKQLPSSSSLQVTAIESTESSSSVTLNERKNSSLILSINLLKKIILVFDNTDFQDWNLWFCRYKLFNRLLSCISLIAQSYDKRKITVEILDLLILFAKGNCSFELLHCDIGDYLWLKLLPPKELLLNQQQQHNQHHATLSSRNQLTTIKWQTQDWWPIYSRGIELVTILLKHHKHHFIKETIMFVGVHEEYLMDSLLLSKQTLEKNAVLLIKRTLELITELVNFDKQWRIEHGQSMINLMRCIQVIMDHSVSLMYRPTILKRLLDGPTKQQQQNHINLLDSTNNLPSNDLIIIMNELIEFIILCTKCLLIFSPKLINLIADPEFLPCLWHPLVEIQFGPPKLNTELYPPLTFGTVLSAVCIFVKALNLQNYQFNEISLDNDKNHLDLTSTSSTNNNSSQTPASSSTVPPVSPRSRTPFVKSVSVTSVSSYVSTTTTIPSNEFLMQLDSHYCTLALEHLLTLLASQSLLALKDINLSSREKQLIRRELSTELLVYHDFVRKRITMGSGDSATKSMFYRKKYGIIQMKQRNDNDHYYDRQHHDNDQERPKNYSSKTSTSKNSMRVHVVRRLHLQQSTPSPPSSSSLLQSKSPPSSSSSSHLIVSPIIDELTTTPTKPILKNEFNKKSLITSTPADHHQQQQSTPGSSAGSIKTINPRSSLKRVMFDENIESRRRLSSENNEGDNDEDDDHVGGGSGGGGSGGGGSGGGGSGGGGSGGCSNSDIEYISSSNDNDVDKNNYVGQSFIKLVEEDYFHFLSIIFSMLSQTDD